MYSKQLIDFTLDIVNLHTLQSMPYLALSALFLIFTLFAFTIEGRTLFAFTIEGSVKKTLCIVLFLSGSLYFYNESINKEQVLFSEFSNLDEDNQKIAEKWFAENGYCLDDTNNCKSKTAIHVKELFKKIDKR